MWGDMSLWNVQGPLLHSGDHIVPRILTVDFTFNLEIFDKIDDGIFGIKLTNKCTDMSIIIFVCYLPPDNSPYGKDVDGFFSHLTAQLHLASDADPIFICGDMNARVGEQNDLLTDQIEDICIPKRKKY